MTDSMALSGLREDIFTGEKPRDALRGYFGLDGGKPFDGAYFEHYGVNDPNRIAADDILATSLLSIRIGAAERQGGWSPQHVLAIEREADRLSELLEQLPSEVDLHDLPASAAAEVLGGDDPAHRSPVGELYEH